MEGSVSQDTGLIAIESKGNKCLIITATSSSDNLTVGKVGKEISPRKLMSKRPWQFYALCMAFVQGRFNK